MPQPISRTTGGPISSPTGRCRVDAAPPPRSAWGQGRRLLGPMPQRRGPWAATWPCAGRHQAGNLSDKVVCGLFIRPGRVWPRSTAARCGLAGSGAAGVGAQPGSGSLCIRQFRRLAEERTPVSGGEDHIGIGPKITWTGSREPSTFRTDHLGGPIIGLLNEMKTP